MVMKSSGISVAAIGFGILVITIDLATIRAAFLPSTEELARLGLPVLELPGALPARFLIPESNGWAVFAFFSLPMIDALLIGVYRLRRRGDHTAGTVGYVIAGSVATLAVFASCLFSPRTAIGMVTTMSRRIASCHRLWHCWLTQGILAGTRAVGEERR
jgi:hypothetical protein